MTEPRTIAQAFAELKAISVEGLTQPLAAVRSAVAAMSDDWPPAAPGVAIGLGDYLPAARNPLQSAAESDQDGRLGTPPSGTSPNPGDIALNPGDPSLGAGIAEALSGALGDWLSPAQSPSDNEDPSGLTAAANDAAATPQESSLDLLREGMEINRSLLELAQGTGIKVDMPDPGWGA
jgi:hypothetical protein